MDTRIFSSRAPLGVGEELGLPRTCEEGGVCAGLPYTTQGTGHVLSRMSTARFVSVTCPQHCIAVPVKFKGDWGPRTSGSLAI